MSVPPEVLAVLQQWVEKAEHDLRIAQHTLTLTEECPYDMICYHAHQCAEKYIKALLIRHDVEFPWIHQLNALANRLPEPTRASLPLDQLAELNPYAVGSRYPGEREPETRDDTMRAVAIARDVREAARRLLPAAALTPPGG